MRIGVKGFVFALLALIASPSIAEVGAERPNVADQSNGKLAALARGLGESMSSAAQHLTEKGRRLEATRALDDARRVARLLRDIAPGARAAELGLNYVREARHALQNGDPARASGFLEQAGGRLNETAARIGGAAPLIDPRQAIGKHVINAKGEELGKIGQFVADPDGRRHAVLLEHGVVDLFGFLSVGNQLVVVPADSLVLGGRLAAVATDVTADQLVASSRYDPRGYTPL